MDNTKTDLLQEIKDEIAHKWFKEHRPIVSEWNFDQIPYESQIGLWPEVCRRAQLECARETLKEASKNAKKGFNDIDRSSITDEANIKLIQ